MSIQLKTPILERSYSSDEFENMPEFDERFELVEGRLVKKPMPTHKHSWIADYTVNTTLLTLTKKLAKC